LGYLIRYSWPLVGRTCPWEWMPPTGFSILSYGSPRAQNVRAGYCYVYEVLAMDTEGRIADVLSDPITVLDVVRPTIRSRTPAANATGVAPSRTIRVTFSEPVRGVSRTTLRLKNLTTGLWVNTKVSYDADTRTASIDPAFLMIRGNRYAVYATSGIEDRSGNSLRSTNWSFRVAP
jgi:hypothetical protein